MKNTKSATNQNKNNKNIKLKKNILPLSKMYNNTKSDTKKNKAVVNESRNLIPARNKIKKYFLDKIKDEIIGHYHCKHFLYLSKKAIIIQAKY